MAIIQNTKNAYNVTAGMTSAGEGTAPDRRRLYDLSNKVATLSPEDSPFFTYLSRVNKIPTSDPVFRFLQDRSKTDWTSRTFQLAAAVNGGSAVTAGSSYTFSVDASSASVDWLVKGMVFVVSSVYGTAGYSQVPVRITSAPVDAGSATSFTGMILDVGETSVSGYNVLADNDYCNVVGSAFGEGTGSPDAWSGEIEDDFGNCQIFKTSCEMSETARATQFRGYQNEWNRIWALKLKEHKIDIERAMLYGHRTTRGNVRFTEGLVGHIVKNAAPSTSDGALSYSSDTPYYRSVAQAEFTFDRLLQDFEVLYDPARGGSSDRLVLSSLPVISFINRLGNGTFLHESLEASATYGLSPFKYNFQEKEGKFGHKLMTVETIHGTAHFTKEMLFRGHALGLCLFADITNLAYRPLVGNGINRDTHIITNVQGNDEDLRKDMILTEAGLQIGLPETHMLYNVEGFSQVL